MISSFFKRTKQNNPPQTNKKPHLVFVCLVLSKQRRHRLEIFSLQNFLCCCFCCFYPPLDLIAKTSLFSCRSSGNKSLFLQLCRLWEIIFLKLHGSQQTRISNSLLTIGSCCSSNPVEFSFPLAKQQNN